MGRRPPGRPITGILLLDKPAGLTSNAALQQIKSHYRARKAGHTGSLDPLATGLLPCCLGDATKFSAFLLDADKRYRVRIHLGVTTATGDAEGEVLATAPVGDLSADQIRAVLDRFIGPLDQLPPMYSAVKHQGERLYRLARQGIEVDRQPRRIHIHALSLVALKLPEIEVDVHCSKGTYIRTLAEDIGRALGCGAHVSALRRMGVGPYIEPGASFITSERIAALAEQGDFNALDALLLPLDTALGHYPALRLSPDAAFYLQQGQAVLVPQAPAEGWVRLYDPNARFIGVGEISDDGRVQPKRLL
ncbi:tRNA pseudouridine(55) synthase TruB [Caldichromatium japonicum]|uniref:tRNA pseudouridine synthase B n=1 Tax=Caldichromatium japonicum TaxID=2699430 RepID=A0A6G7VF28_9GAMM|nr:tRNA pseudouridine(55) synthase TruB [Caldichromatium japonicum]QIK38397.1 tRNA pseudouridine(55) synthase TruB [Caldichromatium japonicum]